MESVNLPTLGKLKGAMPADHSLDVWRVNPNTVVLSTSADVGYLSQPPWDFLGGWAGMGVWPPPWGEALPQVGNTCSEGVPGRVASFLHLSIFTVVSVLPLLTYSKKWEKKELDLNL